MSGESPFEAPSAPSTGEPGGVGPVRAWLGLPVAMYGLALGGVALWALLFEDLQASWIDLAPIGLLMIGCAAAVVGGLRWTERRPAWRWLLVLPPVHVALAALGISG